MSLIPKGATMWAIQLALEFLVWDHFNRANMMPVNWKPLIEAILKIAKSKEVTVTIKKSATAGAIAGGSTFAGALLGGPMGLVAGGLIGTALAYNVAGDVKSLFEVIDEELTKQQKEELAKKLIEALKDVTVGDVAMLAALILNDSNVQEKAMKIAIDYVTAELSGK